MSLRIVKSFQREPSNTLQYRPLPETDEIRLLRLNPRDSTQVTGRLETFSLKEVPDFYALSYVWGNGKPDCRIMVNGHAVYITRSLLNALLQLTAPDGVASGLSSKYIWIDQICINQDDTSERRHQVTLMGSIYSRALKTIIWFGEDKLSLAEQAFAFSVQVESLYLQELVVNENPAPQEAKEYLRFTIFNYSVLEKYDLPPLNDSRWEALNALFSNPWFRRVWVQQEAILSRDEPLILFGKHSCPLLTLSRAQAWLSARDFHYDNILARQSSNLEILSRTRQIRSLGVQKDLSSMLIDLTETFSAKDPRDKIFGVLGVAKNGLERNPDSGTRIRVDYSDSYTCTAAYRDAARHCILSSRNLAILSGAKLRNDHIRDPYRSFGRQGQWQSAPSWVPSFDEGFSPCTTYVCSRLQEPVDPENMLVVLDWQSKCTASKGLPAVIDPMPWQDHDVLSIRGLLVDSIRIQQETTTSIATGMQIYGPEIYFTNPGTLKRDKEYLLPLQRYYGLKNFLHYFLDTAFSGLKRPSVMRLWETALLLTDRHPRDLAAAVFMVATGGFGPSRWRYGPKEVSGFVSWLRRHYMQGRGEGLGIRRLRRKGLAVAADWLLESTTTEPIGYEPGPDTSLLHLGSVDWTNLRKFFVTAEGRLGIGPPGMREGDSICVLFGGGVPFVLRRHESHWLMVGEAFVEGYMEGQAIDAWEKGTIEQQVFEIR